jgi:hypothetical protein
MAKVYNLTTSDYSQADFDKVAHSLLFADSIIPTIAPGAGSESKIELIVTSKVESEPVTAAGNYEVLADDSQSEVAIDIATGKYVEGNIITGIAPLNEIQADVRNFITYNLMGNDKKLFVGVCSTTQSQDYTPDIVANSRVTKMLTPAQVKSLNL